MSQGDRFVNITLYYSDISSPVAGSRICWTVVLSERVTSFLVPPSGVFPAFGRLVVRAGDATQPPGRSVNDGAAGRARLARDCRRQGFTKLYDCPSCQFIAAVVQCVVRMPRDFMEGNYVSIRNFDNYVRIFMGYPPENCAMCGRCTCYFVAEGDGSIFPCDFYVLDEWKLGNVHESSFEELLESEKAKKFVAVSGHISEKCRACRYYPLCRGGCRRDREPLSSGMPSLNRLCPAYEKFFEYTNERMAEMAKKLMAKNYH